MHVAPDAVAVLPNDQADFGMRLQALHAVQHLDAGFQERFGVNHVALLVKTRLQLHQCSDAFAVSGGLGQRRDNRAGAAGAIQRNLNRQHLVILGSLLDKTHHWGEILVGMD